MSLPAKGCRWGSTWGWRSINLTLCCSKAWVHLPLQPELSMTCQYYILLCPCWPLNSVFFLPKCLLLMYFWTRATDSLSTHFAQLNDPLSSCLSPWEHSVKKPNHPSPVLSTWSKGNIFLTRTQDLCFHITSYHFHVAPILFCFYWKYLSQCRFKMHLFFSWLRKNPLLWFTIILRLNTALQPLPPPFQHSALNIVYIKMHI